MRATTASILSILITLGVEFVKQSEMRCAAFYCAVFMPSVIPDSQWGAGFHVTWY